MWKENKSEINVDKVSDTKFYTNRYNTFPHLIIFQKLLGNQKAYALSDPLTINLIGKENGHICIHFLKLSEYHKS